MTHPHVNKGGKETQSSKWSSKYMYCGRVKLERVQYNLLGCFMSQGLGLIESGLNLA